MSRRTLLILGGIVLVILLVGVMLLGRRDQTTQRELLPGTLQPSPNSEQILEGEPPAVLPAP